MYKKYVKIRDQKGLTDYKVAQGAGVNRSTFSEWKMGRSTPKPDKLRKIADFLEVPLEYFYSEDAEQTEGYYIDPETAAAAQELFSRPDLRALLDAARDSQPQDVKMAIDMLRRFKATNKDG